MLVPLTAADRVALAPEAAVALPPRPGLSDKGWFTGCRRQASLPRSGAAMSVDTRTRLQNETVESRRRGVTRATGQTVGRWTTPLSARGSAALERMSSLR